MTEFDQDPQPRDSAEDEVTLRAESVSGRKLSPAAMKGFHRGRRPANAGQRYRIDLLTPGEVKALMNACGGGRFGARNRALIATLYRAGLRVSEALALQPGDLDIERGTLTVLNGKGGKRRIVGIDLDAVNVVCDWI